MGNHLTSCGPEVMSCIPRGSAIDRHKKVQVLRPEGELIEFITPVLVKDILADFSGYQLSNKDAEHLPDDFELKVGEAYHVVPSCHSASPIKDMEDSDGVKRIKVLLTKQEFEKLLADKISVCEVLSAIEQRACGRGDSPRDWRPMLDSIPEGNE